MAEQTVQIPKGDELHRFILQTFAATGQSPTLSQIQEHLGVSSAVTEERIAELERIGSIHRSPGDTLITHAYPFSNEPTAHRVSLADGPTIHAMCAIDALGVPLMLRRNADIASQCEMCGADIVVAVQAERIIRCEPDSLVVWMAAAKEGCILADAVCPDINFFCSPEHLAGWLANAEKKGAKLGINDALRRAREVFGRLMD